MNQVFHNLTKIKNIEKIFNVPDELKEYAYAYSLM